MRVHFQMPVQNRLSHHVQFQSITHMPEPRQSSSSALACSRTASGSMAGPALKLYGRGILDILHSRLAQTRGQYFRGRDVFVVLGVPRGERKSWVVWEEGKAPDVIIELLSDSTRERDETLKKHVYREQLRIPEYYWYDPFNPDDWAGFRLSGMEYQPLSPDESGRMLSQQLQLSLLRWPGIYRGVSATWLRWATPQGELLPIGDERAEQERSRAEQERQRAERAEQSLLATQQRSRP